MARPGRPPKNLAEDAKKPGRKPRKVKALGNPNIAKSGAATQFKAGNQAGTIVHKKMGDKHTWVELKSAAKSLLGEHHCFVHEIAGPIYDIEVLAYIMLYEAVGKGQVWAIKEALDREMGKPKAVVEMAVNKKQEINLNWTATQESDPGSQDPAQTLRSGLDITAQVDVHPPDGS